MVGIVFYHVNVMWIGQGCETVSSVCDKQPEGSSREFFFTLENCKRELGKKHKRYLCASGHDFDKPHSTIYSNYKNVFYVDQIQK